MHANFPGIRGLERRRSNFTPSPRLLQVTRQRSQRLGRDLGVRRLVGVVATELDGGAGFGKRGIDEMRRSRFNPTRLPTIPGGQPSQFEEVWVISRPEGERKRPSNDESPGGGCLITSVRNPAGVQQVVTVPLAATEVTADIVSYIASVNVKQIFSNPYSEKIEAVYVFPLPENAAVNDFVMTVGDRRIRGVIRDKEEAKVIYENAKSQGYAASLLEQNRPNIFTQKVANIEPGKQIDVDITYFSTLSCSDGEFEFAFPLVVGPRFNPAGFYGGIGAVGTGAPATASGSRSASCPRRKPVGWAPRISSLRGRTRRSNSRSARGRARSSCRKRLRIRT
jgi:hypothetical protein